MSLLDYSIFQDRSAGETELTQEQEEHVDRISEFISSYVATGVIAPLMLSVIGLTVAILSGSITVLKVVGLMMVASPIVFTLLTGLYIHENTIDADVVRELSSHISILRLVTVPTILILAAQRFFVTQIQSDPTSSLPADEVSQILFLLSVGFVFVPSITMALSRYVETQNIKSAVIVGVFSVIVTLLISVPVFS